ncbi:hypothetical protein ATKI12_1049 [Kitasatospora sp. Ki12]
MRQGRAGSGLIGDRFGTGERIVPSRIKSWTRPLRVVKHRNVGLRFR